MLLLCGDHDEFAPQKDGNTKPERAVGSRSDKRPRHAVSIATAASPIMLSAPGAASCRSATRPGPTYRRQGRLPRVGAECQPAARLGSVGRPLRGRRNRRGVGFQPARQKNRAMSCGSQVYRRAGKLKKTRWDRFPTCTNSEILRLAVVSAGPNEHGQVENLPHVTALATENRSDGPRKTAAPGIAAPAAVVNRRMTSRPNVSRCVRQQPIDLAHRGHRLRPATGRHPAPVFCLENGTSQIIRQQQ